MFLAYREDAGLFASKIKIDEKIEHDKGYENPKGFDSIMQNK